MNFMKFFGLILPVLFGFNLAAAQSDVIMKANHEGALEGLRVWTKTWQQVFGHQFGPPGPRIAPYPLHSTVQNNKVVAIDVLSIQLIAPQPGQGNTYGQINQNLDNGQPFMYFSEIPGDVYWSSSRVGCSINGIGIDWKLQGFHPTSPRCELVPGRIYYLNISFIDGLIAQTSGDAVDVCNFNGGPNYAATCHFWSQNLLAHIEPPLE